MKYYQAPMEGITGYIWRNAYRKYYGGADRYFTPFLVGLEFSSREKNEVLPEHNDGTDTVPQILTNHADEFLYMAKNLKERYGYTEVNLNLGCPSGTVVSKNRGSGFLRTLDELDRFLDTIYAGCDLGISVKTRIGVESADDWGKIIAMYNQYPLSELIIHPRLQKQGYGGTPDREAFIQAARESRHSLIYNGDINSAGDLKILEKEVSGFSGVMCGRGLIARPWLLEELRGGRADDSRETLLSFTDEIYRDYQKIMSGDRTVLYKMKELWGYLSENVTEDRKLLKKIRKCQTCAQYDAVVAAIERPGKKGAQHD